MIVSLNLLHAVYLLSLKKICIFLFTLIKEHLLLMFSIQQDIKISHSRYIKTFATEYKCLFFLLFDFKNIQSNSVFKLFKKGFYSPFFCR